MAEDETKVDSVCVNDQTHIHGTKRKGLERNGDSQDSDSSMDRDDECDCDACVLGFDDSRPGEVVEPVKRKLLAVNNLCT